MIGAAVYRRLKQPLKFVAQSKRYGFLGGLTIDSNNRSAVLDTALDALHSGFPVVIFPEGNSNHNPELRVGKTGVARLALRSGLPVIPVGIKGIRGTTAWRAVIWFFSLIAPCHIDIGQPMIFPKTAIDDEETELLRTTTDTILREISDLSGKPMPGEGPVLGRHGFVWFFLWRLFRPLMQWRVRIHGAENLPTHGPYIVAANHTSYFDAPTLAMAIFHITGVQPMFPTKGTVARTFRRWFGQVMIDSLGYLPLDETNRSNVLDAAVNHLRHDGVIGIFPEGTRNKPGLNPKWQSAMLRGKTGVARLAIMTGAPIIPASIKAPKGLGILESVVKAILPWNFFRVTFGPVLQLSDVPASIDHVTKENLDAVTTQVMQPIAQLSGYDYPY